MDNENQECTEHICIEPLEDMSLPSNSQEPAISMQHTTKLDPKKPEPQPEPNLPDTIVELHDTSINARSNTTVEMMDTATDSQEVFSSLSVQTSKGNPKSKLDVDSSVQTSVKDSSTQAEFNISQNNEPQTSSSITIIKDNPKESVFKEVATITGENGEEYGIAEVIQLHGLDVKSMSQEEIQKVVMQQIKCAEENSDKTDSDMVIEYVTMNEHEIQEVKCAEISKMVEDQLSRSRTGGRIDDVQVFQTDDGSEIKVKLASTGRDGKVITIQDKSGESVKNVKKIPVISSRIADLPGHDGSKGESLLEYKKFKNHSDTKSLQEYVIVSLPDGTKVTRERVDRWTTVRYLSLSGLIHTL